MEEIVKLIWFITQHLVLFGSHKYSANLINLAKQELEPQTIVSFEHSATKSNAIWNGCAKFVKFCGLEINLTLAKYTFAMR